MSGASTAIRCGETRRVQRWTTHRRSVGLARDELRAALAEWGLTRIEEPAVLVLSELVTNAIEHAYVRGRDIETLFCRGPEGVRIAVDDADERHHPQMRPQGEAGGRGLVLVEALSERWGVTARRGVGKSVWAVITVPGGRWL
ncbi:ATP-binding protein [Streptomyces sp. UNOB3_S3]|uniref:ATP-binding protein n=1 Tax=Streptomyces sp. UNOB3_S3 TaxID=2871682 RepID=UPI0023B13AA8|nr:ATP-binding protein [Streptomyces sp. UNOB3_S3]MCC3779123.1 ATP-binding protein [Streptomyces sp. UNOB3_S3]